MLSDAARVQIEARIKVLDKVVAGCEKQLESLRTQTNMELQTLALAKTDLEALHNDLFLEA